MSRTILIKVQYYKLQLLLFPILGSPGSHSFRAKNTKVVYESHTSSPVTRCAYHPTGQIWPERKSVQYEETRNKKQIGNPQIMKQSNR